MLKVKNLKTILLMLFGAILCVVTLFTCSAQSAYADDNADHVIGKVIKSDGQSMEFHNIYELLDIYNGQYKDEIEVTIDLQDDLDLVNKNFFVLKDKTCNLNLHNHTIYSFDEGHGDISLLGKLVVTGDENNHGHIKGRKNDFILSIGEDSSIQAKYVDFENKDTGYSDVCSSFISLTNTSCDSSFDYCNFTVDGDEDGVFRSYCIKNESTYHFDHCTFENCHCGGQGSVIHNEADSLNFSFKDTTIKNCSSDDEGGAIATFGDYVTYTFDHSTIENCSAGNDGGAIYVKGSHTNIIGTPETNNNNNSLHYKGFQKNSSTISKCKSTDNGGAIYTSNASGCGNFVNIKGINFVDNYCEDYGGAVCTYGAANNLIECCFDSNTANDTAGAAYCECHGWWEMADRPSIVMCEFFKNYANACGTTNCVETDDWSTKLIHDNRLYYIDRYSFEKDFHHSESELKDCMTPFNIKGITLGTIKIDTESYPFTDIKELNYYCNSILISESLDISLYKNIDFKDKTLTIPSGKKVAFRMQQSKIYTTSNDKAPMFVVNGEMDLYGNDKNYCNVESKPLCTAMYVDGGRVSAKNVSFVKSANADGMADRGGHFYFKNLKSHEFSTVNFHSCNFTGSSAKQGGAMYFESTCGKVNCHFSDCNFSNCHAKDQGGAIYNKANDIVLDFFFTNIKNCSCDGEGGAIAALGDYQSYLFDSLIIDSCRAEKFGGAFYVSGNNVDIKEKARLIDNIISNCSAGCDGGAVYVSGSENQGECIAIRNITFKNNKAGRFGGAIYCMKKCDASKQIVLTKCEFTNNSTDTNLCRTLCLGDWCKDRVNSNVLYYRGDSFNPALEFNSDCWKDCIDARHPII